MSQNMVGFKFDKKQRVIEFLPESEQLNSKKKRRSIFFNLYNYYIDSDMRLTNAEIENGKNIYEVFQNKILNLSDLNFNIKLCKKFKRLIYGSKHSELFFDLDDMFLHLVYERAKKVNPKANVILLEKSIVISDPKTEAPSALLIPAYIKLDSKVPNANPLVQEHIREACKVLNKTDEIKQVYLVYPKHPNFTKHISINLNDKVKLQSEEYRVKVIPYSFSFCTRNGRATIVGDKWSTEGYEYDESTAENDDGSLFCGLGIDEDNQYDLTDDRIDSWIKIIKPHFE